MPKHVRWVGIKIPHSVIYRNAVASKLFSQGGNIRELFLSRGQILPRAEEEIAAHLNDED